MQDPECCRQKESNDRVLCDDGYTQQAPLAIQLKGPNESFPQEINARNIEPVVCATRKERVLHPEMTALLFVEKWRPH